jgi:hypothetical protein
LPLVEFFFVKKYSIQSLRLPFPIIWLKFEQGKVEVSE